MAGVPDDFSQGLALGLDLAHAVGRPFTEGRHKDVCEDFVLFPYPIWHGNVVDDLEVCIEIKWRIAYSAATHGEQPK